MGATGWPSTANGVRCVRDKCTVGMLWTCYGYAMYMRYAMHMLWVRRRGRRICYGCAVAMPSPPHLIYYWHGRLVVRPAMNMPVVMPRDLDGYAIGGMRWICHGERYGYGVAVGLPRVSRESARSALGVRRGYAMNTPRVCCQSAVGWHEKAINMPNACDFQRMWRVRRGM